MRYILMQGIIGYARHSGRRNNVSIFALFIFIILISPIINIEAGVKAVDNIQFDLSGTPTRREYSSLSGTFNITEVATTRIIGDQYAIGWGKLGTRALMKDINGDGIDDLIIGASGAPGPNDAPNAGAINIWWGKSGIPPDTIDLSVDTPDLRILGGSDDTALFGDITTGDLNGDNETDLIIGNPSQPEGGKMYILWSVDLTQDVIEIQRINPLDPNGEPWGFIRTEDYTIVGGRTALQVYANYQVANSLFADDLDNDGYDDLLFTSHGWENMTIFWGSDDKWQIGVEYTLIYDLTNSGFYSYDIAIGHINDNNMTDLVVGAPIRDHLDLRSNQCGAVFVYFDIGASRGNHLMSSPEGARPIIYGDDSYDRLGRRILLEDLNHDGLDDIIVAAPDADGPGNNRKDSGSIYIYYGGEVNKFPSEMFAWERADYIIHGIRGSKGDIPGDRLGNMFDIGDIDDDGDHDFVFGLYTHSSGDKNSIGSVLGYDGDTIIKSGRKTADLASIEPRFRFWGMDFEDQLGYQVAMGDMNDDGADDIIATMPTADGTDNSRPKCGESFLMLGSTTSVGGMSLGGDGAISDTVFAGGDPVVMNFTYFNTRGVSPMDGASLRLDPSGENIAMEITSSGVSLSNDRFGQIELLDGCEHGIDGMKGWFRFEMRLGWYIPLDEEVDVHLMIDISGGDNITRSYPYAFSVIRDVRFSGDHVLHRNSVEMVNTNEWIHPGDLLSFSGLKIVYDSIHEVEINPGSCEVGLLWEGDPVGSTEYMDPEWSLDVTIPSISTINYSLSIDLNIGIEPSGIGSTFVPSAGSTYDITFKVDLLPPAPPTNLILLPDGEEEGLYDDDSEWYVTWADPSINETESGIKGYTIQLDDGEHSDVLVRGGLNGSYFSDHHFEEYEYGTEDLRIDFDWGHFGPDINTKVIRIPPEDFSVRWHGWISLEGYLEDSITFKGTGLVKVYLNGELAMDWTDITKDNSIEIPGSPELVPIEVYYRQRGDTSVVIMMTADGYGGYSPVSSDHLYYSGKEGVISVENGNTFSVSVRSVDWVGRTSERITTRGVIDDTPPDIDLRGFPSWVGETRPILSVKITDPIIGKFIGSGPADDPLEYRIRGGVDSQWTDWTSSRVDFDGINAEFSPILHEDFNGQIQLRATDVVGNFRETSYLPLAVDMKGPEFDVLSPDLTRVFLVDVLNIVLRLKDIDGSGVNASTAVWRTGSEPGNWSEWHRFNGSGIDEEIAVDGSVYIGYGTIYIQFSAVDAIGNEGLSDPIELTSIMRVIDDPPVPVIRSPSNGTRTTEGRRLYLDATGTTDDGYINPGHVTYTWYSDRTGYLGSGINVSVYLVLGFHNITLHVFDGIPDHNVTKSVRVEIIPVEIEPGDGKPLIEDEKTYWAAVIIGIGALLLLGVGFLLIIRNRNQAGKEMMLGYSTRTQDDYDYDKWIEEEERKLGIRSDED